MLFRPGVDLVRTGGCLGYEPLGEEERANINAVLDSGHLTSGKWTSRFEAGLARYYGVKHAIAVNSGSSANLLAIAAMIEAFDLKLGDEIITVAAGFPTTVAPIVQHGLIPVFVDIRLSDCNADPGQLERAVSPRTRAVMFAHTLGFPFDVDAIRRFCIANLANDLIVIEDNCDAAGSEWRGKRTGSFGDLATLSFYPAHHMTTGEGGAVITDSDNLDRIIRSLRDWGRDCYCPPNCDNTCGKRFDQKFGSLPNGYDHKYVYSRLGYNLKMTDMQAAIGVAQLDRLDDTVEARRENWQFFNAAIGGGPFTCQIPKIEYVSSPFGFLVVTRSAEARRRAVAHLEAAKIQTRPLFAGNLLRHPAMRDVRHRIAGSPSLLPRIEFSRDTDHRIAAQLPFTDAAMNCAFWIGVHPRLTNEMKSYVAEKLYEAVRL